MTYYSKRRRSTSSTTVASLFFLLVVFALLFVSCSVELKRGTITAKIVGVEMLKSSENTTEIVLTDKEVLENDDSLVWGKFNSNDYSSYLRQHIGEELTMDVVGIRVPFLSWHRNIIKIHGWDGKLGN